jgi:hypothetical protein
MRPATKAVVAGITLERRKKMKTKTNLKAGTPGPVFI